jgi:hypothetical protein
MNKFRMYINKDSFYLARALFFAFIVASFFAFILPIDGFKDRGSYIRMASKPFEEMRDYWNEGFLSWFFNEPVFYLINTALKVFPLSSEQALATLIFLSSFLFYSSIFSKAKYHTLKIILLLSAPMIFNNFVMQIRQGVAIAIFTFVWLHCEKSFLWRSSVLFFASLIHSSFFIIFLLYLVYKFMKVIHFDRLSFIFIFILIGVFIGVFLIDFAIMLGARQGFQYLDISTNNSGLGLIFIFLPILILLYMRSYTISSDDFFLTCVFAFYCGMYFYFPVARRILENVLPLIFLLALRGGGLYVWMQFSIFSLWIAAYYFVNFSRPFLGMGRVFYD